MIWQKWVLLAYLMTVVVVFVGRTGTSRKVTRFDAACAVVEFVVVAALVVSM